MKSNVEQIVEQYLRDNHCIGPDDSCCGNDVYLGMDFSELTQLIEKIVVQKLDKLRDVYCKEGTFLCSFTNYDNDRPNAAADFITSVDSQFDRSDVVVQNYVLYAAPDVSQSGVETLRYRVIEFLESCLNDAIGQR